jgi:hypothetical protein
MLAYAKLLLIAGCALATATAEDPALPPDAAPAGATPGAGEAEQLVAAGRQAMQDSNADPSRSVAAAVSFSKAIKYYEAAGDIDKVCDLEANIFWCKKRMNVDDVKAFVAQKAGDKSVTEALAKADAVATREIPKTEAKNYFDRAEKYAKEHPEDYEQISVHYFEVAERFVGTDLSLQAQKLSLAAQQQQMKQIKTAKEAERQTLFTRSAAAAASAGQLAPVPAAAALHAAVVSVKKLYKDNYAKTKPSQKRRLAVKLLEQVAATKDDPVTQYALLSESIDLSVSVADWYTTFSACDAMAQYFKGIDAKAKKKEVFTKARGNPTAQAILKLLDNPADAEANALAGKYFCFEAGNWDIGLPLLAQGSDADLKAAAEMEMLTPAGSAEQVELGDKWYALGKKAKQPAQLGMLARAVSWYKQAAPSLTGVTKERIDQRSDEIYLQVPETDVDYAHITVKQWDRLLTKSIDIKADNPSNDIGLILTKGAKVVIVPHPTDTWTMHYEGWHWSSGAPNVFDTDATGLIPKEHDHRMMSGSGLLGIIGAMLVTVAGSPPVKPGELEGEGKVLIGPNTPGSTGGAGGTGAGKIRIKVVILEED